MIVTSSPLPHFQKAWEAFKAYPRVFVTSTLVLFALWVALELAVVALFRFGVVPNVILHLAFLLLFSGLMVGILGIALDVVDGEAPSLRGLTAFLDRGPHFLLALSLYTVAFAGGLLLLVAPGIYLGVRYGLFGPVFGTRDATALDALREAGSLSQGRWWSVCRFLLAVFALNLAGAVLLGLGLLISLPVSLLALSSFFRTLQRTAFPR